MKKLFSIFCISLAALGAFAQNTDTDDEPNEKIAALKIGFITEKLDLTGKEAEGFWPVFNRYESEVKALRKKQRQAAAAFKTKTNVTEAEADKFLADQVALKQQELDVLKKYIPEFKRVLPSAKVARLLSLEQEFKLQLLKRIKEQRQSQRK